MEMSLSYKLFLNMNSFLCNLNSTMDVTGLLLQKSLILSSFPHRKEKIVMPVPTASSGISPIIYFHPFYIVCRG